MNNRKKLLKDQEILLAFVITTIIAVVSMISPKFIAVRNLITIFQQISVIGILTITMSMLLISGDIDLSMRNIMVLSGVVMVQIINTNKNIPLAVTAEVGTVVACGVFNGFVIAGNKYIPLIITLGTSQVLCGLALTVSGGRIMSFGDAFNTIRKTKLFDIFSVVLFVPAAMTMLSYFLINETKFGRRIMAIGGNERDVFLSGINVTRYKIVIYVIAGFFCAIATVISSVRIDSITANAGIGYEANALTAAIIDGVTFDGDKEVVPGVFLGCVLMGVISSTMNILQVKTYIQTIITRAIIVCTVMLSNINNIKKK